MGAPEIRYGVFLRPDAATCWNVAQVTFALQRQFGLVSAGAFPPHATLIGNLATDGDASRLISALDPVFADVAPFPVFNHGVVHRRGVYTYELNLAADGAAVNVPLNDVAHRVKNAVAPLSVPVTDHLVTPVAEYEFAGHLGLASHDLLVDDRLAEEVGDFLATVPITPPPASFVATWYSLFEFTADWSGPWWTAMTWRHLHSWSARG